MGSTTENFGLYKPNNEETGWGTAVAENFDIIDGALSTPGPAGATGAPGIGIPAGGIAGQILTKQSSTQYDTVWAEPAVSGVVITEMAIPLGANAIYTGGPTSPEGFTLFSVTARGDQSFTLLVEDSPDGVTFLPLAVASSVSSGSRHVASVTSPPVDSYIRVVLTNGATSQSVLRVDVGFTA